MGLFDKKNDHQHPKPRASGESGNYVPLQPIRSISSQKHNTWNDESDAHQRGLRRRSSDTIPRFLEDTEDEEDSRRESPQRTKFRDRSSLTEIELGRTDAGNVRTV